MRRTGWGGSLPSSDEEAVERIVAASREAIETAGAQLNLSDVARILQVTRPTIYRYFPSTESLMFAVAIDSGESLANRLVEACRGITNAGDAVVEIMTRTVEFMRQDRAIMFLLDEGTIEGLFDGSITDVTSRKVAMEILLSLDVDWEASAYPEDQLDELITWILTVLSALMTPSARESDFDGDQLRRFLTRWVRPAIVGPGETTSPNP